MCAVQLYNAARIDLPTLDEDISNGRFDGLLSWLRCKVHVIGSLHATADEVMLAATGKAIDPQEFTRQVYTVVESITRQAPCVTRHTSHVTSRITRHTLQQVHSREIQRDLRTVKGWLQ